MGLPNDLTLITVTGTFTTITGTPLSGQVNFSLTTPVEDSTGKVIFNAFTQSAVLNGAGSMSIVLPCTDNADLNPPNFSYLVTEAIQGLGRAYYVQLPHTLGSAVDLSQLAPVATPPATSAFATANTWTAPQTFAGNPPIKIPSGAASGYVLTSDGSGGASWQASSGGVTSVTAGDTSITVGGTSSAPAIETGTLDAIAADHPPAGNWSNNSHKITGLANGASASDAAAFGQIPVADATAAHFQPAGTAAAGANGEWSDSGHVHPYEPWQFYVAAYGAKGNGKVVIDGAMSSSSNPTHLACTTSTPFGSATAGMAIHVGGAGGGTYTPLCTTISTVTDSGHVVLAASATSTVSGGIVYFGTDDTTAIQNAINAAVTYAQAHNGYAEVLFDPLMYIIGGSESPVNNNSGLGNALLTLPLIATTVQKVTIVFRGTCEQTGLIHWLQTTPQAAGTVLACARNDGTNDVTYGPSFVVGGPVDGYGDGTVSNALITVDGVGIMVPYNGKYGGWGFYGMGEAAVLNGSVMAAGVVPGSSSVPSQGTHTNIANTFPVGLQMPDVDNNDNCDIGRYSCEGLAVGLQMSEHTWFSSIRLINIVAGIQCGSWGGVSMPHTCGGDHASIENCGSALVGLGSTSNVFIGRMDLESYGDSVYDPNDYLSGIVGVAYNGSPAYGSEGAGPVNGAVDLRIIDLRQIPGPVASPQAPPASGSPWANLYYRDAWITLHAAGTITALGMGTAPTAQNVPAAALTYGFMLPSGQSYTPTYGGTALTHTVTLL